MSSHSVDFSISFMGRTLTPVDSARDLGIIMDNHLTYNSHISYLVSSCLSKLVQINRVNKSFVNNILMLIILSLVFRKMFYCSSVWSNTSKKTKLQPIQNFACRIITGSQKYDHVTPLLQQLMCLSANEMLQIRVSFIAYKCANNLAPEYLCVKFKKRWSVHDRATCNNNKLTLLKTFSSQHTFAYRAVSLWNSLHQGLQSSTSVKAFKFSLKTSMLNERDNL